MKTMLSSENLMPFTKGSLMSERFSLWLHLQKNVPNHNPKYYLANEKMLRIVIWPIFWSQIETLFEIKLLLLVYSKILDLISTGLLTRLAQRVPPTMASTVVGGCPIKLKPISISSNSNSANQWTNLTSTFSNPHTLANHCRMIRPVDFRRKSTLKFHPIPILQEGTVIQNQ